MNAKTIVVDLFFFTSGSSFASGIIILNSWLVRRRWRKTFVRLPFSNELLPFRLNIVNRVNELFENGYDTQTVGVMISKEFPEIMNERFRYSIAVENARRNPDSSPDWKYSKF